MFFRRACQRKNEKSGVSAAKIEFGVYRQTETDANKCRFFLYMRTIGVIIYVMKPPLFAAAPFFKIGLCNIVNCCSEPRTTAYSHLHQHRALFYIRRCFVCFPLLSVIMVCGKQKVIHYKYWKDKK